MNQEGVITWAIDGKQPRVLLRVMNAHTRQGLPVAPGVFGVLAVLALRGDPRLVRAADAMGVVLQWPEDSPAPVPLPELPPCSLAQGEALIQIVRVVGAAWSKLTPRLKDWLTTWAAQLDCKEAKDDGEDVSTASDAGAASALDSTGGAGPEQGPG